MASSFSFSFSVFRRSSCSRSSSSCFLISLFCLFISSSSSFTFRSSSKSFWFSRILSLRMLFWASCWTICSSSYFRLFNATLLASMSRLRWYLEDCTSAYWCCKFCTSSLSPNIAFEMRLVFTIVTLILCRWPQTVLIEFTYWRISLTSSFTERIRTGACLIASA